MRVYSLCLWSDSIVLVVVCFGVFVFFLTVGIICVMCAVCVSCLFVCVTVFGVLL